MTDWPADFESQFWSLYPRRIAKIDAMKALRKVHASGTVSWAKLTGALVQYRAWLAERGPNTWRPEPKHPATWLRSGGWDDEYRSGSNGRIIGDGAEWRDKIVREQFAERDRYDAEQAAKRQRMN